MGTITKRDNGKYQVKLRRSGLPAHSKTFTNLKDAQRWMVEQERAIETGANPASGMLLADLLQLEIGRSDKKQASVLRFLAGQSIGKVALFRLRRDHLANLRDSMLDSDLSNSTTRRRMVVLKGVLSRAVDSGLLRENPSSGLSLPSDSDSRDFRVPPWQVEKLVAFSESPSLPAVICFAVETGMRRGELAGLEWERVDFDRCLIRLFARHTKTKKERVIPLSSRALAILRSMDSRSGSVFGLAPDSISQAFGRAADRADLGHLHFHDLRHEAICRYFERGLSVAQVMSISGHRSLSSLSRYTHLAPLDALPLLG